MLKRILCCAVACVSVGASAAAGATVEFTLLTHADNAKLLPQPRLVVGVSGDHLIRTSDDITGATFNPDGCFSFNFMNPIGIDPPDYPPGYTEGIHSMTGAFHLDVDLHAGGTVKLAELAFNGYVTATNRTAQWLIRPGDTAANGNYGQVDGQPNSGSYSASAQANWAFELDLDWYYDTPYGGVGTIDMTFGDYSWSGYIIPVSQLTPAGMGLVTLDDPLGFFGGSSADFESWLLNQVKPRLPADATWLLFAQGTANPVWVNQYMGMSTDGVVSQTIVAYATVPEPATATLLLAGVLCCLAARRSRN